MTEIVDKEQENHFIVWFGKNYKADPKQPGWFIDKVIKGAKATIDGARSMHTHIYKMMKENGDL